jgi:hypothetical protein
MSVLLPATNDEVMLMLTVFRCACKLEMDGKTLFSIGVASLKGKQVALLGGTEHSLLGVKGSFMNLTKAKLADFF